jgi:UPF0176 protein
LQATLRQYWTQGTILLSFEGINVVLAGNEQAATKFQHLIHDDSRFADLHFKRSVSAYQPFDRMLVKVKKEIITMRVPGIDPARQRLLCCARRTQALARGSRRRSADTRNAFEVDAEHSTTPWI